MIINMGFFFSGEEQKSCDTTILSALAKKNGCLICPLHKTKIKSPCMLPTGSSAPLIYLLGESPGKAEDTYKSDTLQGRHFIGKDGELLRKELSTIFGKHYEKIIRFNNIVRCYTGENSIAPTEFEIECCKSSLVGDIEETKPKVIIGAGDIPLKQILDIQTIGLQRGRMFPAKVGNHICWYFPILHPSFILRKKSKYKYVENEYDRVFRQDLHKVHSFLFNHYKEPIYIDSGYKDNVYYQIYENAEKLDELQIILNDFAELPLIAIDIETTGLKPYKGDKFISIAISNYETTFAFNLNALTIPLLNKFLYNSGTKICHMLKFELEWFAYYFGDSIVYETEWADTQALAYVLDGRKGALSLDYQCFLNFGFNIKSLSQVERKNLIEEKLEDVLLYNGLDAKYTYLLYKKLSDDKEFNTKPKLKDVCNTLVETAKMLALTQKKGVLIDKSILNNFELDLDSQIKNAIEKLQSREEIKKYEQWFGTFNPNSHVHVRKLLLDILEFKLDKKIDYIVENFDSEILSDEITNNRFSTDKTVLLQYAKEGSIICQLLLDYKELYKLQSTYVKPIPDLIDSDGKLRTQFNHCFTNTGRLSSSSINLQNLPKRKNKHIRNIVIASEGYKFVAVDYSAIEYRVIGMASRDKKVCDAIIKGYDPHKAWALKLVELYPEYAKVKNVKELENDKVKLKKIRDEIKNLFVFPVIYGATIRSIQKYLSIPIEIAESLYKAFFEIHEGIKEYQTKITEIYNKYGYVESLFGRLRRSPISRNEIYNTSIQADASDIVINAMNRLSKHAIKTSKNQFQPILNVHDDISFYLPIEILEDNITYIVKEMCNPCFDFINVPLGVEVSIGNSWGDLKEFGKFETTMFDYTR